ncbi:hypothetical protein Tco_0711238, partial [Tanacetum coccineum]
PEEELAREEEFEGVVGPEKELAFPKVISSVGSIFFNETLIYCQLCGI